MEIRFGWATAYGANKFDVSMDETDLLRLFTEIGLTASQHKLVLENECFVILETTARSYGHMEAMRYADTADARDNYRALAAAAIAERKVCVAQIRQRLNIPVQEEPAGDSAPA